MRNRGFSIGPSEEEDDEGATTASAPRKTSRVTLKDEPELKLIVDDEQGEAGDED